ncbi:MAG: 30S ribosomal protein S6 [Candidatus Curtissbacteria bacterium]|nr:30S ribosomal protein S6 [Candidatus Curtissbacteria bacterium]
MYELIVVGTVDGAAALFERVEKFLKEANAQNVKSEKMGKKPLAYKIAKQTEAEYFLFNFDADPAEILALDRKIRLEQEAVLRHLLIKVKPQRKSKSKVPPGGRAGKVESPADTKALAGRQSEKKEEPKVEVKPKVTVTTKVTTSKKEAKPVKSTSKAPKAKGKK